MAIIEELYFALPIYIGNMMPVFVRKINFLNYPINVKLFGEHKTYRGFVSAIIIAILVFYLQSYLHDFEIIKKISLINYEKENLILLGFLSGFGAMFGDLIKSYFKRRRRIKPGESWVPFDQLDFMIGALIVIYPFVNLNFLNIITLLLITPFLHIIANYIGYYTGLRENKW